MQPWNNAFENTVPKLERSSLPKHDIGTHGLVSSLPCELASFRVHATTIFLTLVQELLASSNQLANHSLDDIHVLIPLGRCLLLLRPVVRKDLSSLCTPFLP